MGLASMLYHVIYDGNCHLCVTLVQLLEKLDQDQRFDYLPMQDTAALIPLGITPQDCALGMIVINAAQPQERWQGSEAAEAIGRIFPHGRVFVETYRALPGMKWLGDDLRSVEDHHTYAQVRDHRYTLFGQRPQTYQPQYPVCADGNCRMP